jgi:ArsR family transcriptional regulator
MVHNRDRLKEPRPRTRVAAPPSGADFIRLMADSTRRRILLQLMHGETCNADMAEGLDLPRNLVSHHLRLLRQSGLIQERRDPQDQRLVYFSIDRRAYRRAYTRAYAQLVRLFDPARIENRTAVRRQTVRRVRPHSW